MPTTTNRTLWPTTGGTISLQPGWFQGHATAFFYVNLGFGTDGPDGGPPNMSFPMVPVFQIVGPNKQPYPGSICLTQVPLPANTVVNVGDNATIQVVETAIHGAALYSVGFSPSWYPHLQQPPTYRLIPYGGNSGPCPPSQLPKTRTPPPSPLTDTG